MVFSKERLVTPGPAIFLDRDGVINCRRPGDYVLEWSQFVFVPGIQAALKKLSTLRLPMIVISNQACVGKGLLDPLALQEITNRMHQTLLADGVCLAAAYYCPHRTEDHCNCRKPKPALLKAAGNDFNVDLHQSVFIGDSDTDIQASLAAGCCPILFGSTRSEICENLEGNRENRFSVAQTAEELFDVTLRRVSSGVNSGGGLNSFAGGPAGSVS